MCETLFKRVGKRQALTRCGLEILEHSRVEHVYGVIERLGGFGKVRCRGMPKNATRVFTALALANIYLGRQRLMLKPIPECRRARTLLRSPWRLSGRY